ncbi:hypothetical protein JM654_19395 [Microbacterium oxydans]|nr:hypothetical protein [Microbacterium oxydans]
MTPVMREVVVRIVATVPLAGAAVRAVLPRVGAAVTATASSPGPRSPGRRPRRRDSACAMASAGSFGSVAMR